MCLSLAPVYVWMLIFFSQPHKVLLHPATSGCGHACMHAHTQACTHACTHTYVHVCMHAHLSNDLQSAYKQFYSMETALLKMHNDIVDNMDNGKVTAFTLLDLSAALDTIDHLMLLQRLPRHFGISGPALQWFKSYF